MKAKRTKKVRVLMPISVHPFKAKIWEGIQNGKIRTGMSLRAIATICGEPSMAPQQVKHHLQVMVTMGTIDWINGQYCLEKS